MNTWKLIKNPIFEDYWFRRPINCIMKLTRFMSGNMLRVLSFVLITSSLSGVGHSQIATSVTADALVGLWSSNIIFAPARKELISVRRDANRWFAKLGSIESKVEMNGSDVVFVFPNNLGSYRGHLTKDGSFFDGFWIQPQGEAIGGWAIPLRLVRGGGQIWKGSIDIPEDNFTLYLKIFKDAQGVLTGAFRNREFNSIGGATQFQVAQDGQFVRFEREVRGRRINHDATLFRSPDRLSIRWPDLDRTIDLTRRNPEQASQFFPRPFAESRYEYRKPAEIGDGWKSARAADVGVNEDTLRRIVQKVIDSDPSAAQPTLMHSILVAHKGRLILDEYFYGYDRDTLHPTRSLSKTFSSVMLGAAMMRGTQISPETKVYELLSGLGPFTNPDPRKSQIAVAHLLTHSAGFACDDNDDKSPGNEEVMQAQKNQPNWWKYTLDLPMVAHPGNKYAYCSANMNLVGAALTVSTRTWLPDLFDQTIASPLGFGPYYWNLMPNGDGYLGGGVFMRPRDLLKVGQVFLDDGAWKGKQIVSKEWVKRSTTPPPEIYPGNASLDPVGKDSYAWHLSPITSGGHTYYAYNANGNGGQVLLVVPELELTVVFTGGNYRQGNWVKWIPDIVGSEIIPAMKH